MIIIIYNFLLPLILTIIIESAVSFILGYRGRLFYFTIVTVNFITNPFLNFVILLIGFFGLLKSYYLFVLPMEVLIVFVEWMLLKYATRKDSKSLLLLSAVMNSASFLTGLLIF
ncbi:MAG: hypothetical protein Q8920_08835 [Bacillota bacterium]|nr:hypothetical protein [Bacillota bacterium]